MNIQCSKLLLLVAAMVYMTNVCYAQDTDGQDSNAINPLDLSLRDSWLKTNGQWTFDQDLSLTGTGDSAIKFQQSFKTPFQFMCEVEVLDGMRPRIYFGDTWIFANEGDSTTFGLYPDGPSGQHVPYDLNRRYKIQIDITSSSIEARVDDHLIDSRQTGMDIVPFILFRGGDDWSPGSTRFYNIRITGVPSESGATSPSASSVPVQGLSFDGAQWIWFPEGKPALDAPAAARYFRDTITLPSGRKLTKATCLITADNMFELSINGKKAGQSADLSHPVTVDVTSLLHAGNNMVEIMATNLAVPAGFPDPAGLIAKLHVEFAQGDPLDVITDAHWKASTNRNAWTAAMALGAYGIDPWGKVGAAVPPAESGTASPPAPPVPVQDLSLDGAQWIWFPEGNPAHDAPVGTRYFRQTITLPPTRKPTKATCLITADDTFQLSINGKKAGQSDNWQQPLTLDVTSLLQTNDNTIEITAKNVAQTNGCPTNSAGLIAKLHIEFAEGKPLDVITDGHWEASTDHDSWSPALAMGAYGIDPWGKVVVAAPPSQTAPGSGSGQSDSSFGAGGQPAAPAVPEHAAPTVTLAEDQARAVVLITGDNAEGTGFLIKTPNGPAVVTNIHVIANNPNLKITTSTGALIKVLSMKGASDRDLAMLAVQDANYTYLEMATDISQIVQTGDEVVTPGNSEGGEVMLDTGGKVLGIGPERIEFDNPIYHGNSGGPVVHTKSGKVLGVVTEAIKVDVSDELDKASYASRNSAISGSMRYFGLRLDTVTAWVPIDSRRIQNETAFLDQFDKRTRCLDSFLNAPNDDKPEDTLWQADPKITRSNSEFFEQATGADIAQQLNADRIMWAEITDLADSDMAAIQKPVNFYSFDQQRARDELAYRKALKAELDQINSDVNRLGSLPRTNSSN